MENTPPKTKEDRLYHIVRTGIELLAEQKGYKHINLLHKMEVLNRVVSPSSLSNIFHKKPAGLPVLTTAAEGIQVIIRRELGLEYSRETHTFVSIEDPAWQAYIIPEGTEPNAADTGLILHTEGRVPIQYKTGFIGSAQKEVVEVGVRLKTFTDYFFSRKDSEYKDFIVGLLRKGVTFRGYLLDPEANEARLYFDDRIRVQETEVDAIAEMKKVLEKLKRLIREFEQPHYPGTFEIYLYKHVPYNHFLVVDQHLDGGKMMVSHYLYGVRRAECPVWEFSKSKQPDLFQKYADSLEFFIRDAKRLV